MRPYSPFIDPQTRAAFMAAVTPAEAQTILEQYGVKLHPLPDGTPVITSADLAQAMGVSGSQLGFTRTYYKQELTQQGLRMLAHWEIAEAGAPLFRTETLPNQAYIWPAKAALNYALLPSTAKIPNAIAYRLKGHEKNQTAESVRQAVILDYANTRYCGSRSHLHRHYLTVRALCAYLYLDFEAVVTKTHLPRHYDTERFAYLEKPFYFSNEAGRVITQDAAINYVLDFSAILPSADDWSEGRLCPDTEAEKTRAFVQRANDLREELLAKQAELQSLLKEHELYWETHSQ